MDRRRWSQVTRACLVLGALGVLVAVPGCSDGEPTRSCSNDDGCLQGGIAGMCLRSPTSLNKWCAYPDATCASELRYGVLAGDGLAQMCVAGDAPLADAGIDGGGGGADAGVDGGGGGTPDGGPIDAAVPDAAPGPDAAPYLVNGQAADIVLGQADFTSTFENSGGLSARSMGLVSGIASDGTHLWVYDFGNSRVLQWNTLPTTNFEPADVVIGKSSFTSTTDGPTQSLLSPPAIVVAGMASAGAKVVVADPWASRTMIWSVAPSTNGAAAARVLGQSSFTVSAPETSDTPAPNQIWSDGTRLTVGFQSGTFKVAYWSTFPVSNGQGPTKIFDTRAIAFDGAKLIANDGNRLRIWNTMPATLSVAPDVVIGQPDLASDECLPLGPTSICNSFAVPVVADGRLFMGDGRGRVLIFEPVPTSSTAVPKYVVGAPNFTTAGAPASATTLGSAHAVTVAGGYLWVASGSSNRVVGFKLGPP